MKCSLKDGNKTRRQTSHQEECNYASPNTIDSTVEDAKLGLSCFPESDN